jgi:hypothetical protein
VTVTDTADANSELASALRFTGAHRSATSRNEMVVACATLAAATSFATGTSTLW